MNEVQETIDFLIINKKNLCCEAKPNLLEPLEALGFEVCPKKAGHKVIIHVALSQKTGFCSFSIDCGHKPKKAMKLCYPSNAIKVLRTYQYELQEIIDERN